MSHFVIYPQFAWVRGQGQEVIVGHHCKALDSPFPPGVQHGEAWEPHCAGERRECHCSSRQREHHCQAEDLHTCWQWLLLPSPHWDPQTALPDPDRVYQDLAKATAKEKISELTDLLTMWVWFCHFDSLKWLFTLRASCQWCWSGAFSLWLPGKSE